MGKTKLFNDPIYGLIELRYDILYDIIDEPYFQRLRRIKQMGLSDYVYPGATHTRFQHALGATHLLQQAMDSLERKGVEITNDEKLATSIAVLCHDIGHGPFSHALERKIVDIPHEEITKIYLHHIAKQYGSIVDLSIKIFEGSYEKKFLHQLVSSQLDVDRLDYLSRDSFYSGVAEGVIGYDRIIRMMNVYNNEIVVEEKGIYSIEKFLTSRFLMYMQVYFHKTSLAAEKMLESLVTCVKEKMFDHRKFKMSSYLEYLLGIENVITDKEEFIHNFSLLDDNDILDLMKNNVNHSEKTVNFLANSLLTRKLFRVHLHPNLETSNLSNEVYNGLQELFDVSDFKYLVFQGEYVIDKYSKRKAEILIQNKDNQIKTLSESIYNFGQYENDSTMLKYLIYPKII